MTRCPTPQLLQRLLADRLPDAETGAAGAHVEACPRCQQVLESLTALEATDGTAPSPSAPRPDSRGKAVGSMRRANGDALREGELRRLRHLLCPAATAHGTGLAPAE